MRSAKSAVTQSQEPIEALDLTGLKCPLPVLKVRRRISQMAVGDQLNVIADDPASPLDFEHFCSIGGHSLVSTQDENGAFNFFIIVGAGLNA